MHTLTKGNLELNKTHHKSKHVFCDVCLWVFVSWVVSVLPLRVSLSPLYPYTRAGAPPLVRRGPIKSRLPLYLPWICYICNTSCKALPWTPRRGQTTATDPGPTDDTHFGIPPRTIYPLPFNISSSAMANPLKPSTDILTAKRHFS